MASSGIGTSNLKPKVAEGDAFVNIKLLSENSFYTRFNFELVTENTNSLGESISIDFQGKDLLDFIQFKTNLVLPIDDISESFSGISSLTVGDSISGVSTFTLNYNESSLFEKSYNSDLDIASSPSEKLVLRKLNHDFSTGELLDYEYEGDYPIEIVDATFPGIGLTSFLPSKVYAIRNTVNLISIAANESDALAGIGVTFVSVGAGTTHKFYSTNVNTRSLITIDGLIQSPLYSKGISIGLGTNYLGISTTVVNLSGISSIRLDDFIYLDDEIMRVNSISSGTTSVVVERGSMGTVAAAHTDGSLARIYTGQYNISKDKIHFSSPPLESSNFTGRVFYKKRYDKNVVFDDLSRQFVGAAKTFNLKYNGSNYGLSTSTVSGEPYGILVLNGIFQKPVSNYVLESTSGISTITFTGNTLYDLPNSGKILSFDYDGGSNYQRQVAAAATVTVSAAGTITDITLTGNGGGYQEAPIVSLSSTVGSGATIVALVGTGSSVGLITGFTITNPGTGYTTSPVPTVIIESPYGYTNIPLTYVSGTNTGEGAKISFTVGAGGSITSVDVDDIGVGYVNGDVLTVSGIGTLSGNTPFTLTITDTYSDKSSFWSFGQLIRTSIPDVPDGIKRIFAINNILTGNPIDFEANTSDARSSVTNNILVFIDSILQKPIINYKIKKGYLYFTSPVPKGQNIDAYVYIASDEDSVSRDILQTVKPGDILRIKGRPGQEVDQDPRGVYRIESKNRVRTASYSGFGINDSEDAFRKVDWTKQTRDSVISDRKFYKTREIYDPLIKPTSSLIAGIGTTSTSIYVKNIDIFDADQITESQLQVEVVKDISLNQAFGTAVISAAGTVTAINITDGGFGYTQDDPPTVSISNTSITSLVELETFLSSENPSNIKYFDSESSDSLIVSVGSSLSLRYSQNLISFTNTSIASSTTDLKTISYGNDLWVVAGSDGYISTSKNLTTWNPLSIFTINSATFPLSFSPFEFNGNINSLTYDSNVFVGVGSTGHIFSYNIDESSNLYNKVIRIPSDSSVSNFTSETLNKVIFGEYYGLVPGTQFVAVGNSATILLSPEIFEDVRLGEKSISWTTRNLSTLGGENLNSIVNTGISTMPYIVVGDNGLTLIFDDDQLRDGRYYNATGFTSENLKSIVYDSSRELAVVVGTSGTIFTSPRSSSFRTWTLVSSGTTSNLNNIEKFKPRDKYLSVGDDESVISVTQKIGAAATAIVSVAGTVSSIVITNGGRNYGSAPNVIIEPPEVRTERFKSCAIKGDYGRITGITTTSGISTTTPALKFKLEVSDLLVDLVRSGIETGDYFVVFDTNIGSGVTSILDNRSIVGIATTFIDGVFRADKVDNDGISGFVTVTSNVQSVDGLTSIATTYYSYGNYSWGKIYSFDERVDPKVWNAYSLNGFSGLSTSPKIIRVTSIGTTVVPLEA